MWYKVCWRNPTIEWRIGHDEDPFQQCSPGKEVRNVRSQCLGKTEGFQRFQTKRGLPRSLSIGRLVARVEFPVASHSCMASHRKRHGRVTVTAKGRPRIDVRRPSYLSGFHGFFRLSLGHEPLTSIQSLIHSSDICVISD
jgi:hypothetical protein